MAFIEMVKKLDKILLLLINHDSLHRYLDTVMILIRNPFTWIPLYTFFIAYFFMKMRKEAWLLILFTLINVAITDSLSNLLKNIFQRLRPCYDSEIGSMVRSLVGCGGEYSFPSSHAANHFGMAAFWFVVIYKLTGQKWKWLWIWAALICYAQMYVGKHFPTDILAGALLGVIVGGLMAMIFERSVDTKFNLANFTFSFTGNHP